MSSETDNSGGQEGWKIDQKVREMHRDCKSIMDTWTLKNYKWCA